MVHYRTGGYKRGNVGHPNNCQLSTVNCQLKKNCQLSIVNCQFSKTKTASFSRSGFLCWHYLSSRQVTLQVLSARTSLTSVFGMGTGGPSSQSIPTYVGCTRQLLCQKPKLLTSGAPSGTRTRDPLIKSQLLYQLS